MDNLNIDMGTLYELALAYGVQFLTAVAIFMIGKWASKAVTRVACNVMEKANVDKTLISFAKNIIYALLVTFVAVAALGQLGIETTSIAAVFAAAGLAIGLALQGSLSNLAAGVMIILFRPFKVGDFIEAAGVAGSVDDLNIFTTTLKTPDNKSIIVPNNSITGGNITNFSARDTRRIDLVVGIGYDDDIKAAKKLFEKVLKAEKRILAEPEPTIAVMELGASSVDFAIRPWVKSGDFWSVKCDLTEALKIEMDKAGISIPYPQQDVHIHTTANENETKKAKAPAKKKTTKKKAA